MEGRLLLKSTEGPADGFHAKEGGRGQGKLKRTALLFLHLALLFSAAVIAGRNHHYVFPFCVYFLATFLPFCFCSLCMFTHGRSGENRESTTAEWFLQSAMFSLGGGGGGGGEASSPSFPIYRTHESNRLRMPGTHATERGQGRGDNSLVSPSLFAFLLSPD